MEQFIVLMLKRRRCACWWGASESSLSEKIPLLVHSTLSSRSWGWRHSAGKSHVFEILKSHLQQHSVQGEEADELRTLENKQTLPSISKSASEKAALIESRHAPRTPTSEAFRATSSTDMEPAATPTVMTGVVVALICHVPIRDTSNCLKAARSHVLGLTVSCI